MNDKLLDASWDQWLRDNIRRGCDLGEVLGTLRKQGFTDAVIAQSLDAAMPRDGGDGESRAPPPLLRRMPPGLRKVNTDKLELYTLDDFMSEKECQRLVALINHHLRPSTVAWDNGDRGFRTSQTSDLALLRSPLALATDAKICKTMGIRAEYSEGIQAQRYDIGQQFKGHMDYFEPGSLEYVRYTAARGNRTWTFMVYLNEDMQGGGTKFFAIDRTFQPKRGQALLWNNLHADGTTNKNTMHSGEPVIAGHKLIITKWFRELGEGKPFYD